MRHAVSFVLCLVVSAGVASGQNVIDPPSFTKTVNLSGPRFGMTALSTGVVDELKKRDIEVGSNISQFGWQFEKQFYTRNSGVAAVNEWVFLLGGLDQAWFCRVSAGWWGCEPARAPSLESAPTSRRPEWRWPWPAASRFAPAI